MKFYVASSLKNYEQVRELAGLLKDAGWEHTYDWTAHCPPGKLDRETLKSIAEKEVEGIARCDAFILLPPLGRGAHTELGMAIALKKRIVLCHRDDALFQQEENVPAFYCLDSIGHLSGNAQEIARKLVAEE